MLTRPALWSFVVMLRHESDPMAALKEMHIGSKAGLVDSMEWIPADLSGVDLDRKQIVTFK